MVGERFDFRAMRMDWRGFLGSLFSRRSRKKRLEEATRQWFLLCGTRPDDLTQTPNVSTLHPLMPPADRFWADPFLWSRQGRHHVFLEEYPYADARGVISVMEIDAQGVSLGPAKPIIERPYHLSYPYLFEVDGELYMVPEQKAARRVELFHCVEYPNRFVPVATWFKGVRMVDVTVFQHEERWWLFCAVKEKGLRYDESLCAFYTDHPVTGTWSPHPMNPLVKDIRKGRPGGRVFKDQQGRLLRPSQDCGPHYGAGLNLSLIEELTPTSFRESTLWHLSGEAAGGWRGLHHLDVHHDLMVMDAERTVP